MQNANKHNPNPLSPANRPSAGRECGPGRLAGDCVRIVVEFGLESIGVLERIAEALERSSSLPIVRHVDETPALTTNVTFDDGGQQRSPYLDAEAAAEYLGITVKSLYGVVERRHLEPLRGPRRTYRFTQEILDDYLKRR